jgi:ATP-dependent RNA helicase RhlE
VNLRHAVIYGGVSQRRQERDLAQRPDLLVATPGRLLDLMRQGLVSLGSIEILVLDEADTMLDMGFIHDIKRLVAEVPKQRQTLLFSATMPTAIEALVRSMTRSPVRVSVSPESTPAERVSQSVFFVARSQKSSF